MSVSMSQELQLLKLSKRGMNAAKLGGYQQKGPKRKKRVLRERAEQVAVVNWANETIINGVLVGDFLTHVANEGKRGPQARKDFVELGGRAGYTDLIIDIPTAYYHGLRIEMKAPAPYDAPVTPAQEACHARLRSMGYRVEVCRGFEAAKAVIVNYLNNN